MRAVRYHEHGGPEVMQADDVERPDPDRGEVLIKVRGAGINPVDAKFREGTYAPEALLPLTPGSDVAGVVTAVGPGIEGYRPGDRVFGTQLGIDGQGTCAEYVLATSDRIARLPETVDFRVGAAIGIVGVTAWESLIELAGLRPGDVFLVHGGNGGVGHVSVQLAAAAGATVIATASPAYHDELSELGADAVLDYAREDLVEAIGDVGAPDVVLDHMLDAHLQLNTDVGAPGHRIVDIGSEPVVRYGNVGSARGKNQTLHHLAVISHENVSGPLGRVARLLATGDLTATVARTYELEDTAQAHRDVASESFLGKLVVEP